LDPLDDCEEPAKPPAATDSSLVLKNYTKFEPIYNKLSQRHDSIMSAVPNRKQVEKDLSDDNANNFEMFYMG
jgi:ssDNA-specific exonuclease RecJ